MKVTGYIVWKYDDGTVVSSDVEFDPDRLFAYARYGPFAIHTPHPDHRTLMEHILTNVKEACVIQPFAGPGD